MGASAPPKSHESLKHGSVSLEFKGRYFPTSPDAKTGLADNGGILPSHSEIDFLLNSGVSVQQSPGTTATKPGIALVAPVAQ